MNFIKDGQRLLTKFISSKGMFIDLALVGLAFLFSIPAVTAYFAYSHGRSFWLWFFIGCLLPVLANFIIIYLCRKEAIKAQRRRLSALSRYEDEWMTHYISDFVDISFPHKKYPGE